MMHTGSLSPRRIGHDEFRFRSVTQDKRVPRRREKIVEVQDPIESQDSAVHTIREKIVEAQDPIELMKLLLKGEAVEYCYNQHYGVYFTFFPNNRLPSEGYENASSDVSVLVQDGDREYRYDPVGKGSRDRSSVDIRIDTILETVRRFRIAREAVPAGNISDEDLLKAIKSALTIESYIRFKRGSSIEEEVAPAAEYKDIDTRWSPFASLPSDMDTSFLDDKKYPQGRSHVLEAVYSGTYDRVLDEPGAISYELSAVGYPDAIADAMEKFILWKRKEFLYNIGVAFKPNSEIFNPTKPSRY